MALILAAGIYLADRPNTAPAVMQALASSTRHRVTQRWLALAPGGTGRVDLPHTVAVTHDQAPKFTLLDRLTADAAGFDWVLLCDDDIEVGDGFVDGLIAAAERFDFALAQPARTTDSFIDHPIVAAIPGLAARQTRFVEIGPVLCIRRDAVPLLLPFGAECGMGWGLDFIWPVRLEAAGLRLGIIDSVPVAHRLRPPVTGYTHAAANAAMERLLATEPHLPRDVAFTTLAEYR